jgi:type III restriction enzyme
MNLSRGRRLRIRSAPSTKALRILELSCRRRSPGREILEETRRAGTRRPDPSSYRRSRRRSQTPRCRQDAGDRGADLTRWLLKKIGAYRELADKDLRRYIDTALQELQKKHSPQKLYGMKYQIRDRLQECLNAHYLRWTERGYEELKDKGDLTAEPGVAYRIPDEMELPRSQCTISFQRSIFEFPGKLNAEELEFAGKLDALDNVACWYRNPDKDGFSLQGYWKARFNPDLIAFTDSGKTAVLEYKGEDRVTNEDSRYKESLGNDWAALDPERRYFKMVTKGNMQSTLKEIEEL